ncbi:DUF1799 domain-containing protein [Oceaniglobus trochenteri]|uniref:DUF1799 domain-containing protein n=1 Tax=Oceaniglobus trochenteri TaxID=2763260 RepID=UPI001CFFE87E
MLGLALDPTELGAARRPCAPWSCHLAALRAFEAVSGQWRVATLGMGGLIWMGLDHGAVRAGLELAGIVMTPDLWEEVRGIELGALEVLNGN